MNRNVLLFGHYYGALIALVGARDVIGGHLLGWPPRGLAFLCVGVGLYLLNGLHLERLAESERLADARRYRARKRPSEVEMQLEGEQRREAA